MALDIEQVRGASMADFCALALCEFSRFVDAIERIAPDGEPSTAAPTMANDAACPCPPEFRQRRAGVMGEAVVFECGLCSQPVPPQVEG